MIVQDPHIEDLLDEASPGRWLMACEPVSGSVLPSGGRQHYKPGTRFLVRSVVAGSVTCAVEGERYVAFSADALPGLELAPAAG